MKSYCRKCFYLLFSLVFFLTTPLFASERSYLAAFALPVIGFAYSATSNDYEGLREWAYSCAFTAQVTTLLKNGIRRTRPNGENDLSFPSGHASASFVGASFMHHRYGLNWGLPMYAIATGISIQRVNVDDHYWTDIIAGAALGYIAGYLFTTRCPGIWIAPEFDSRQKSYGLQFKINL